MADPPDADPRNCPVGVIADQVESEPNPQVQIESIFARQPGQGDGDRKLRVRRNPVNPALKADDLRKTYTPPEVQSQRIGGTVRNSPGIEIDHGKFYVAVGLETIGGTTRH